MQTLTNRRKNGRISKDFRVFFGLNGTPYMGNLKNISSGGIGIVSNTVFQPGAQLDLLIKAGESEVYATGMVRWCNMLGQNDQTDQMHGMGLQIDKGNKAFHEFVIEVDSRFAEAREKRRFEKVLNVTYNCAEDLMQAYTQNISLGGMFVATRDLLAIGSIIDVDIYLADVNDHIKIEGQVVYKVDVDDAENAYMDPGVGIEILRYYGKHQQKFQKYLNEWMIKSD